MEAIYMLREHEMIIENRGGQQTVLATAMADYKKTFDKQIKKGMDKYGVVLSTFNGRDAGQDAVEELVDLSVYIAQLRMEHQAFAEILCCILVDNPQLPLPNAVFRSIAEKFPRADVKELKRKWGLND